MKEKQGNVEKGVRLSVLSVTMLVIALVLSLLLLRSTSMTDAGYRALQEDTVRYMDSLRDADDMRAGSDYLTEQVRAFAVTGDARRVENYFTELNETRRRDKALENLNSTFAGTETYRFLSAALDYSNALVDVEYYAMRLVIEGCGYDAAAYPEALQAVELSAEDRAMSSGEQLEKARDMVYDDQYQGYKDAINENINLCLETMIGQTEQQRQQSSDVFQSLLQRQELVSVAYLAMVILFVALTGALVIRPLTLCVQHMRRQEKLPILGVDELRYLSDTYNHLLEENRQSQDQLSYEASHDALTGLYNRRVFDSLREAGDWDNAALILVDVDHFKSVNDNYGHDIGDRILQKVASLLQSSFRSEDYVCRIGGDEFAVIMVHAGSALRELVERKINAVNEQLHRSGDDLPAVSLSVGVAFGDRENPEGDLYQDADTAQYRVKEAGRNGCAFY